MMIREPVVAGRFYSGSPDACLAELKECLDQEVEGPPVEGVISGGMVPHAGWVCSGSVAAKVFRAIADQGGADTVVLLGAVHRVMGSRAAMFSRGAWETPLGRAMVDDRLAERVMGATNLIDDDAARHEPEHSIEVQVPFVQHLLPEAKILPVMVPPSPKAVEVGRAIGRTIASSGVKAVVVGSSDLTHYGPSYGFTPHGSGREGIVWAKEENDRALLRLVDEMKADDVVAEAQRHRNACGAGAIAAAMGASLELGAKRGVILEHASSFETLSKRFGESGADSVGYAGAVFVRD